MKYIPTFESFLNENSTGSWNNANIEKAAELINKEVGKNPGYFFIGDEGLIKQFDKFWGEQKYKQALNLLFGIDDLKDLQDYIKQNKD
jgi:hypothetical protein